MPEPCVEYIKSTMFSTSFHLFASASLSIPSGRAGVATAVGNGGGFGGRPVWGIKLCVARGSMVSCGFEYWQASDVGSTANKSKHIGQDNVMIGKTRRHNQSCNSFFQHAWNTLLTYYCRYLPKCALCFELLVSVRFCSFLYNCMPLIS